MPCPKDILPNAGEVEEEKANADAHAESDYHRTDEQVITNVHRENRILDRHLS